MPAIPMAEGSELVREMRLLANTEIKNCVQCRLCTMKCPAAKEMDVPPHEMVKALLTADEHALLTARSSWKCLSCFTCTSRCPRKVSSANVMEAVRLTIIRQQGRNRLAAETLEHFDPAIPQQAFVAAFRKFNK